MRLTEEEIIEAFGDQYHGDPIEGSMPIARRIERAVVEKWAKRAETAPCSGTACCMKVIAVEMRASLEEKE